MAEALSESTAEFGRRVRAARSAAGHTQEGFALVCDLDRSYIGQVERGEKNVTLHTMLQICEALDLDVGELLHDFGDRSAKA